MVLCALLAVSGVLLLPTAQAARSLDDADYSAQALPTVAVEGASEDHLLAASSELMGA